MGYNLDLGGTNHGPLSLEQRKKISNTLLGHIVSEETRAKLREKIYTSPLYRCRLGKQHSKETKEKIRLAGTGKKHTEMSKQLTKDSVQNYYTSDIAHEQIRKDGSYLVRRVRCIETGIIYQSISAAKKATGIKHILDCCKGHRNKAGGYH